jgi:hypothetical protein
MRQQQRTEELSDREWLARLYENHPSRDGTPSPGYIHEALVNRAQQFLEQRVAELAARPTAEVVYNAHQRGADEAEVTLLVRNTLEQALRQARIDAAAAIREGRV